MKGNNTVYKKMGFYNIFFFGVIPIIITGILLARSIVIYSTISITAVEELEKFIEADGWMELGFSVISIAVSVWLGINIANLIDRKQIYELEDRIKESKEKIKKQEIEIDHKINNTKNEVESEIKDINNDIENRFYKTRFIDKLMETKNLYESSLYLYEFFGDNNDADYKSLFEIENEYVLCAEAYENVKWEKAYGHSDQGLMLLSNSKIQEKYKEYFLIRRSDFLFYKNIVLTHNRALGVFSTNELLESIDLYEEMIRLMDNDPNRDSKFIGYLYNTIGYTYDILTRKSKDENEKRKYSSLSIENMETSVRHNDKGRYYRNLGLTYEHSGKLKKAKECYMASFEKDPRDYKAYNNIVSIILKELDQKFNMSSRFDEHTLLSGLNGVNEMDKVTLLDELKQISKYEEFAEKANPWFEDIYFNTCKMYMYFYIFSGYKTTKYIETAIEYGKKTLFLNKNSIGGKFVLRNTYECYGNLKEAKKINDELLMENRGDSKKVNELYIYHMSK